jgi:hypothetical protein
LSSRRHLRILIDVSHFSRLEKIEGGSGILISVMKAIDVLLGHELRTLCETAHKALSGGSRAADEVRAKLSLITATSLDGRALSKIDMLLADVSHGRVAMSMELENYDEVYAGKFVTLSPSDKRRRMEMVWKLDAWECYKWVKDC